MKKSVQRCTDLTSSQRSYSGQLLTALCLTFIMSSSAFAGIYKWTDEEGKVHYGSERPEDAQAEKMQLHVPGPATPPDAQQEAEGEDQETDNPKKEAKLKDGGDQEKANEERTAYCENERKRLQTVEKNKEIHEKDASGKVSKMNSEARNQRLNKIRANISKYCK